ncbi:hypothetical protein D9M68_957750 [compost metagenome]
MTNNGKAREVTCAANSASAASHAPPPCASSASNATLLSNASTSAIAPKLPMRESFMISSARSRSALPPRPSARSARPSSWKAPVSSTPNTVLATAATQGAAGNGDNSSNAP